MRSLATLGRYAASPHAEPRGIAAALFARSALPPTRRSRRSRCSGQAAIRATITCLCADPVHLAADRDTRRARAARSTTCRSDEADDARPRCSIGISPATDCASRRCGPIAWFARGAERAGHRDDAARRRARTRCCIANLPRGADGGTGGAGKTRSRCCCTSIRSTPRAKHAGGARSTASGSGAAAGLPMSARCPRRVVERGAGSASATSRAASRATRMARSPTCRASGDFGRALARATASARRPMPTRRDRRRSRFAAVRRHGCAPIERLARACARHDSRRATSMRLHLIADGNGAAATWTARAAALWRRIARARRIAAIPHSGAPPTHDRSPPGPRRASTLLLAAGVSPVLARIYAARGIVDAARARLLARRAARFRAARQYRRRRRAARAGDRATASASSSSPITTPTAQPRARSACAACARWARDVDFLVPNRFEFGYGLTPEIVAVAAQRAPRLLVTVDNGIASVDGVARRGRRAASTCSSPIIICRAPTLPAPAIIVNPNQAGLRRSRRSTSPASA